jgi:hypothetical protein
MKRLLALVLMLLPVVAVTGCPIYPDECDSSRDCALGYACDRGLGECVWVEDERPGPGDPDVPTRCSDSNDCRSGQTCDEFYRCVTARGGGAGEGSGGAAGESSAGGQNGGAGESPAGSAGESSGGAAGSN